jgi:hypothetical protein
MVQTQLHEPGTSVSIVFDCGLDDWSSIPDKGTGLFLWRLRPDQVPHSLLSSGCGGSFSGGKARPGRDADHWPPSNAEVKKV